MSDARALLRQQREARRITHPHAAYSDTGKLLCTLCREQVKSDSLWEGHIASQGHKQKFSVLKAQSRAQSDAQPAEKSDGGAAMGAQEGKTESSDHAAKRKLDDEMEIDPSDDAPASKRVRSDGSSTAPTTSTNPSTTTTSTTNAPTATSTTPEEDRPSTRTPPPSHSRRSSQTPSQGIELQIPSRPATPRDSAGSSATTTLPSRNLIPGPLLQANGKPSATNGLAGTDGVNGVHGADGANGAGVNGKDRKEVDEDEWAAFEADIAALSNTQDYAEATISAPAMSAEQSALQKDENDADPRRRTSKPEADLADEAEDAARALEEEMDEMRGLEAKVLKLKERREVLRQRAASHGQEGKPSAAAVGGAGKENHGGDEVAIEEESEEEDDDEDEDDWDGFRFRTAAR